MAPDVQVETLSRALEEGASHTRHPLMVLKQAENNMQMRSNMTLQGVKVVSLQNVIKSAKYCCCQTTNSSSLHYFKHNTWCKGSDALYVFIERIWTNRIIIQNILLLFFVLHDSKLNIFRCWSVGREKQAI